MRRLPEALINDIRSKADIVDTISRYLTLSKKGKNYWGICPFHEDHDPSMSVSPDRQIYKCFVCGAGGNVFSFVKDFEKIGFLDAVIKTGDSVGVDLSEYAQSAAPVNPEKERLYELVDEAQKFVSYQLFTHDGLQAQELMKARGYDQALLETFGVGVVYDQNQLIKFLSAKGFNDKELIDADLARMSDMGELRDVFYQRIMFPIHDPYGRAIAFSARALDQDSKVKYINSTETDLYTKGNVLYNYHRAKDAARKAGFVIITEGVTDSIAFTKAGRDNVVSLLGVACTDAQVNLIKQCSQTVILAFDGDKAGYEASFQIGQRLRKANCEVHVWYNDSGLDPDDAVRQLGADVVSKGVDDRIHWYDFILMYGIGNYGLESFENRKRVVEFVLKHLNDADDLEKSYYIKKLAEKTQFDEGVLHQQIKSSLNVPAPKIYTPQASTNGFKVSTAERNIIKQMLVSKEAAYIYRDQLGFLVSDLASDFALVILDSYRHSDIIDVADLLSMDISEGMKMFALEMDTGEYISTYDKEVLLQNIALVKRHLVDLGVSDLRDRQTDKDILDEKTRLLEEAIAALRKKEGA